MSISRSMLTFVLVVFVGLSLAQATAPTSASASGPPDAPDRPIHSVEETMTAVQRATIQIRAEGSFANVDGGEQQSENWGTGFIIDEQGIAVTNNHVVAGAARLQVWVGGERKPQRARVLGVSECSDLAVIDIAGDGYPFLEWYDGSIYPGLDVYAAGYPLGDPEFTLTKGIISKRAADGQTSWASVDGVIEHDATINPGHSGGPVITREGQVVAVNYANRDENRLGISIRYFAIARDEARKIIERLRQDEDVLSLGLNGQAVAADDGSISAIWVRSVKSGSLADEAGIQSGDYVISLEGVDLAADGTMFGYCEILRSHDPDDILDVTVYRPETQEFLEGQINGVPLGSSSPAPTPPDTPTSTSAVTPTPTVELVRDGDYNTVTFGPIEIQVPDEWDEAEGEEINENGSLFFSIAVSGDLDNFQDDFDSPGVLMMVIDERVDPIDLLDAVDQAEYTQDCAASKGRYEYSPSGYVGYYDLYGGCGETDSEVFFVALVPKTLRQNYIVYVVARDLPKADHLFETFRVVGPLP